MATAAENPAPESLDRGTYELLRERLRGHGKELAARVDKLNAARKATFGGVEPELVATERVTTEHNCVPRDIAAVGETLLFGYNVHFGLKAERSPADVFACYTFAENRFHPRSLELLASDAFEKDFKDVYRFYKDASFEKFVNRGPLLYMQLRTGPGDTDIKTFKWALADETLKYVDNRSDHELRLPPQHEFDWKRPRREDHVHGKHPHVNIADKVFVETIGGDLTIKIENNTETGEGIYEEPVENADQTLDDADIRYAVIDSLVILRIRPYQEAADRYIVYCEKTRRAQRLDGIAGTCRLLPADQGILYPSGYLLHTGDGKSFDGIPAGAKFEQRIDAPNGEDSLYVFYDRNEGLYILIRYNLISQAADAPLLCHGFTIFSEGELVCFRGQPEPQRHHAIQIWRTPFSTESLLPEADTNSEIFKIGNREIVRGLSESREILALLDKEDTYGDLYAEIAKRAGDLLDSYYWIRNSATFRLDEPLEQIRAASQATIDEYEKVARARENATKLTQELTKKVNDAIAAATRRRFEAVAEYTETLAELRTLRGETIGLRDVRYTDSTSLDTLEKSLKSESERIAARCVGFLDRPDALKGFTADLAKEREQLPQIKTARDAKEADGRVTKIASDLELLIETVSNLPIEDATQRTRVVDSISAVFSTINSLRAEIRNRRKDLARTEGAAEFGSQLKLLSQAVVNALDRCDSPDKCDQQYSRLLLQVEELEGRFAEFEEFAITLAEKREEIASAFETRKSALLEARAKRAGALASAGERLIGGISARIKTLESAEAIHGYFAGDLTVGKVRDLADQLMKLGEAVRADGLLTKLKSLQDDAVRQLKDRQELFAEGPNVITLGGRRFSVNTQPVDLTTVVRDGQPTLHLTGTRFYEVLDDAELLADRACWDQEYVSETKHVYRGEFLAYSLFEQVRAENRIEEARSMTPAELAAWVSEQMAPRYSEGYLKGIHDHDASLILVALLSVHVELGPLKTPPRARALARLFWQHGCSERVRSRLQSRLEGLRELAKVWPDRIDSKNLIDDLVDALASFLDDVACFEEVDCRLSAQFLVDQLLVSETLAVSDAATKLVEGFYQELDVQSAKPRFQRAIDSAGESPSEKYRVALGWLTAYRKKSTVDGGIRDEAAVLLLPGDGAAESVAADASRSLAGMLGEHPLVTQGKYQFDYYDFLQRLRSHEQETVPQFQRYIARKHQLITQAREELRVDEFKPQVMAAFVRNRLIDTAYLPLIGANLAKQIGVAGEDTRADRQGMLLLISPPGYGKTTLMEYVADRLGLVFLKVNGPAIGHAVTSLDPGAAPNLAAREELKKLSIGFEMGDNVMIYLDDIQHCHTELLQKFISLCDAQRKIEGVWRGEARTYDLRGRKVAVVMAGNPYTESGDKFQISDMLANRADVYNLGDVSGQHQSVFELSFIENALTSNSTLSRLAARTKDAIGILRIAEGGDPSSVELEGRYDAAELDAMIGVMRKLVRIRDVILSVNAEYIRSAAQAEEYRTEPPFKLQGSYRNMNRIAEKVLPVMNETELDELIWSSYRNDAQTLTTGAEANLLKFRELVGWLTAEEASRWEEIKKTFRRNTKLHGLDESDRMGQAIGQLALFADGLSELKEAVASGVNRLADRPDPEHNGSALITQQFESLREGLSKIAASLEGGVQQFADRQPAATPPTFDANLFRELIETMRPRNAAVQIVDGDEEPVTVPDSITIVNKIPPSLLNVLREQFRLMETWLRPVLSNSQRHTAEVAELAEQIKTCLAKYETLVGRIASSRDRRS